MSSLFDSLKYFFYWWYYFISSPACWRYSFPFGRPEGALKATLSLFERVGLFAIFFLPFFFLPPLAPLLLLHFSCRTWFREILPSRFILLFFHPLLYKLAKEREWLHVKYILATVYGHDIALSASSSRVNQLIKYPCECFIESSPGSFSQHLSLLSHSVLALCSHCARTVLALSSHCPRTALALSSHCPRTVLALCSQLPSSVSFPGDDERHCDPSSCPRIPCRNTPVSPKSCSCKLHSTVSLRQDRR